MPLSQSDRRLLKQLDSDALRDRPLSPDSPFYEPIYERLGRDDPVLKIGTQIDFGGSDSIRFFSGFRGAGKTTELLRLGRALEAQGYFVLYADALEYINAAEPVEITDLLVVMAGAFSDSLVKRLGAEAPHETFWDRLWGVLNTQVTIKDATAKLEIQTPAKEVLGGLKTGLDIKIELKSASNFRRRLRTMLANTLKQLKNDVDGFFKDGIALIRRQHGEGMQVVFIFDQLERLHDTSQTDNAVIRSVEHIFANHVDLLRIPDVHAVFTVPPWLKFVRPGSVPIILLSAVYLWKNDPERTRYEPAWEVFRSIIARRLGNDGLLRLFGAPPGQQVLMDKLIAVCGGHFGDLLGLLQRTVHRANTSTGLPIAAELVDRELNTTRQHFLPIALEDARWLAEIAHARASALPSTDAGPVNRLARFLDTHYVLYFSNGDEWYDIHPLIRDDVAKVMRDAAAAAAR